jgi:hypothetical protein
MHAPLFPLSRGPTRRLLPILGCHRQRSAATTAAPPSGAGPEVMLEEARQLLHNPLGPHASTSTAEQWHHDVDQLVVATINTPPHGGEQVNRLPKPSAAHSCSPTAHSRPPLAPRVSSVHVASLATADLRAELERRHSGEDGYVTIELQRKRRRCQGRNLDGDFDAVDTAPVRQAVRTPTPPAGSVGGCMALAPHLRIVVWPRKFWPHLPKKYDGSVNPAEFLHI